MSDLLAWIAAISGLVAAFGTVAAVWVSLSQSRRALQETREAERRRQASGVSVWFEPARSPEEAARGQRWIIVNASELPIYHAVVAPVWLQGAAPHTAEAVLKAARAASECQSAFQPVPLIPRGRWSVYTEDRSDTSMQGIRGADLAFTDAAGVSWIRRSSGALEELQSDPFAYLEIPLPISAFYPERDQTDQ